MHLRPLIVAGIVLGLGLGGFFDGIVLHQIFQWHHMLSAAHPPTSVGSLELNTLWDGLFHATAYVFTATGLFLLWRAVHGTSASLPTRVLVGALLCGWGIFNLVEGIVDHHLLGVHHVMDGLPPGPARLTWDLGFLALGVAMLLGGRALIQAGRRETTAAGRVR